MRRARSVVHAKGGIPIEVQKVAEQNLGDAYQYTRMRRHSCWLTEISSAKSIGYAALKVGMFLEDETEPC
jgi:hypothetical protein